MSSQTLPAILITDVASHKTAKSCYVTIGTKVYDITDFLGSHPGDADLILEYGGRDITNILKDEGSHTHSSAAYDVLDNCLIGFMVTKNFREETVDRTYPLGTDSIQSTNA